jgi:transposase-like protein
MTSNLAKCPSCGSDDVMRVPGSANTGPTDLCTNCSHAWSHKPGTITKRQARVRAMPKEPVLEVLK